jgi:ribonuclease P protein component
MKPYSFYKAERLCSKVLINNLFTKGNRVVTQFPFRVIWQYVPEKTFEFPAQVMVSVSKRTFAHATDRNKIKRQLRELYRLSKPALYQALAAKNKKMVLAIVFQGKSHVPYQQLSPLFDGVIKKIISQLEKTT